jgi:NAD(P)H-hydrate epimerase
MWRQTVVLKGAYTAVAAPDGRAGVNPYANPALASAGTGDVLAGAIAGLLAQGAPPFEAACCGVYLHAAAAEGLRRDLGDAGLIAGDLLPELPRTLRELRGM